MSTTTKDSPYDTGRTYPKGTDIQMAAKEDASRYRFHSPTGGGFISIPATSEELAQELAADEYRGFAPEDFDRFEEDDEIRDAWEPPVESGRPVVENDMWMLQMAHTLYEQKVHNKKNPTETMIQNVLAEWEQPDEIPLNSTDALQQADGIGPKSAKRIVEAAIANELTTQSEAN